MSKRSRNQQSKNTAKLKHTTTFLIILAHSSAHDNHPWREERIQRRAWLGGGALLRWDLQWRWAAGIRPRRWPRRWCGCSTPSRTLCPMLPLRSAAARPASRSRTKSVNQNQLRQRKSDEVSCHMVTVLHCNHPKQMNQHNCHKIRKALNKNQGKNVKNSSCGLRS